jgi:hypothetical protein
MAVVHYAPRRIIMQVKRAPNDALGGRRIHGDHSADQQEWRIGR